MARACGSRSTWIASTPSRFSAKAAAAGAGSAAQATTATSVARQRPSQVGS
jgi:hypothetical protein